LKWLQEDENWMMEKDALDDRLEAKCRLVSAKFRALEELQEWVFQPKVYPAKTEPIQSNLLRRNVIIKAAIVSFRAKSLIIMICMEIGFTRQMIVSRLDLKFR
jgi:hypothetical protein